MDNLDQVPVLRKKVSEVNLLTDPGTSVDVHLPIIHQQSRYHFRQKLSSDVVSYQLTALICKPFQRREDIKTVENSILRARKRIEKAQSPVDLNISPLAAVKLAESMSRLKLTQNKAIYKFLGESTSLLVSCQVFGVVSFMVFVLHIVSLWFGYEEVCCLSFAG